MNVLNRLIPLGVDNPSYLLLLAVIPFIIAMGLRSLAGLGPVRRWLAIGCRSVLIALLVLILAGLYHIRIVNDRVIVFVVDQSRSVPSALQEAAFEFVHKAVQIMRPGKDRVAVLSFDGHAVIEQLASTSLKIDGLQGGNEPDETNLAAALRTAAALVPGDGSARVIVLSDGNENAGDAAREALTLAGLQIPVDVVPLTYHRENEVVVERLDAPQAAQVDDTIQLSLVIRSQKPTTGRVLIYHGDKRIRAGVDGLGFPVEIAPGVNRLRLPIALHDQGVHHFRAEFVPDDPTADALSLNNQGVAFTRVGDKQRVLIVARNDVGAEGVEFRSAQLLVEALTAQGVSCDVVAVEAAELDPTALMAYQAVILNNISAIDLGVDGPSSLASYVRDMGGGLVVLGGDEAFSVGGYYGTALEEVLPVQTNRRKLVTLNLGMVIVLDRSGSMSGNKIQMAREAGISSAKLLSSRDMLGVVAFDTAPDWVVPIQVCTNKDSIIRKVRGVFPGGGTNLYPALTLALEPLLSAPVALRHVIVLSDGQSMPNDFDAIAKQYKKAGITISTIAVGPDADRYLLDRIARMTGGRSYQAVDGRPLPRIFARETVLAGRSSLYEKRFKPHLDPAADELFLQAMITSDLPPLDGYVVTQAKAEATVLITHPVKNGKDPILANWQVGLGRSVAFTSGMWPRWGAKWANWTSFSQFWTEIVRWASRPAGPTDAVVTTRIEGRRGELVVEYAEQGVAAPAVLRGVVVSPDFQGHAIELRQTGPGRYEGGFDVADRGSYVVSIAPGGAAGRLLQSGASLAYSAEYGEIESDAGTLEQLADVSGGRVLSLDQAGRVYDHDLLRDFPARTSLHDRLMIAAVLFLLLDVGVRRIALSPREILDWIRRRFGIPVLASAGERGLATLAGLREVRQKTSAAEVETWSPPNSPVARVRAVERPSGVSAGAPSKTTGRDGDSEIAAGSSISGGIVEEGSSARSVSAGDPAEQSMTARLLSARKRHRSDE